MSVDISALDEQIKNYVNSVASKTAGIIADDLTDEASSSISDFYNDYEPKYYRRHYYNLKENGFRRYYRNPHNTIFYGGVELTPEKMDDLYNAPPEQVFNTVMDGFHGVASMISSGNADMGFVRQTTFVPRMIPSPMDMLLDKRQYIEKNIDKYIEKAQRMVN